MARRQPLTRSWRWTSVVAALLVAVLLLAGCRTLGYYAHVTRGHAELMSRRQPIEQLLADPATDPRLRAQLSPIPSARTFASDVLGLPRNRSYTSYAALERPYVTWNVFAAEEFSVEPVLHCFPVAGCVGYRGYFSPERAEAEAARLRAGGLETYIGGVSAYSTLGWFDDPVLSTMALDRRDQLVGTIFHELAHQRLYASDDTAFNESYARFVQQQGLQQWRAAHGLSEQGEALDYRPVIERILALRERLAALYAEPSPAEAMRSRKQAEIEAFRTDYREWRAGPGHDRAAYDGWVAAPIDNAKLVPFGLYDRWLPAFEQLFEQVGGEWEAFHREAERLAALPFAQRQQVLEDLLARGTQMPAAAQVDLAGDRSAAGGRSEW